MARPAGSPNKPTQALRALLDKRFPGWNPVVEMAALANDPTSPPELRLSASREVAKYIYPQLKAIDLSQDDTHPFRLVVQWTNTES